MDLVREILSYSCLFVTFVTLIVALTWQPRKGKWLFCTFLLLSFVAGLSYRVMNATMQMGVLTWSALAIRILSGGAMILSGVSGLLLLWFAFASRKVGASREPNTYAAFSSGSDMTPAGVDPDLVGIGGWLILPAIGLVLGGILSLAGLAMSIQGYDAYAHTRFGTYFGLSIGIGIMMFVFLLVVAVLFFGKKKSAPAAMIAIIVTGIVTSVILAIVAFSTHEEELAVRSAIGVFTDIVSAAIWIPYFCVSKRVKATFVN